MKRHAILFVDNCTAHKPEVRLNNVSKYAELDNNVAVFEDNDDEEQISSGEVNAGENDEADDSENAKNIPTSLEIENPVSEFVDDFFKSLDVTMLIDQPTRVTFESATLIDQIFTSDLGLIGRSGIIACDLSDHDIIFSELHVTSAALKPKFISYRNYANIDVDQFNRDLSSIPLQLIYRLENVNDKVALLESSLMSLF
ncbi:hypothetical protein QE152_g9080 [Popillia japonica]|uniref:DDE-1 domain-containing protein n=1 Tax=Popillia japonica TaxID=7064 RepID=A0AAW1M0W2_POPJA